MRLLWFNLVTDANDPILGFATSWIRAVAKRVECIHVISMRAGRVDAPENVRVYSVGKEKGYSEPRRAVEFYNHLFRILREDRIDACFSHMIPIFTVLAAPVLKAKNIPIVTWYAHRQVTMILKLAHYFSDRMVASAETAYLYRSDKLVIIGQGIDTHLFTPDATEPESPPRLLSVGRLSPIKDLITLVEAVHLLRQEGYEVHCLVVGETPERDRAYRETVLNRVRALGLEGIVTFAGAIPNDQVVYWYRRCFAHVNLCPTGAPDKGPLEAMACARLSLVANEGFTETLGKYAEQLFFRHGDPEDLAARLRWLLSLDHQERTRIGEYLREHVVKMHSLERLAGRVLQVCGSVR